MWGQREGGNLPAKQRGLRRNQTCWHLDLRLPAPRTDIARSHCLPGREKAATGNQISQHLDLGPPSLQNGAQIYSCNLRPPVYGTFIMAEKSRTNIQKWHPSLPLGTVILFLVLFFLQLQIFQDLFLYIWNTVLHFVSNLHTFISLTFLESRTCVVW